MIHSSLGKFYKKNIKPIKNSLGKAVDFGSDFLPPGFRDAGNFAGKRLRGQSTKQAAIGSVKDYGMGKVLKFAGGKVAGKVKNTLGRGNPLDAANKAGDAATRATMGATRNVGRSSAVDKIMGYGKGKVKNSLTRTIRDKYLGGKPITVGNVLKGAGGAIAKNPLDVAGYAAAGAAGLQAKKNFDKASDYRKQALGVRTKSYEEKAPLRTMGIAGLTKTTKPVEVDELVDPTNTFTRRKVKKAGAF